MDVTQVVLLITILVFIYVYIYDEKSEEETKENTKIKEKTETKKEIKLDNEIPQTTPDSSTLKSSETLENIGKLNQNNIPNESNKIQSKQDTKSIMENSENTNKSDESKNQQKDSPTNIILPRVENFPERINELRNNARQLSGYSTFSPIRKFTEEEDNIGVFDKIKKKFTNMVNPKSEFFILNDSSIDVDIPSIKTIIYDKYGQRLGDLILKTYDRKDLENLLYE
jgi:hypothetical protein